jgi:hypothetical protein
VICAQCWTTWEVGEAKALKNDVKGRTLERQCPRQNTYYLQRNTCWENAKSFKGYIMGLMRPALIKFFIHIRKISRYEGVTNRWRQKCVIVYVRARSIKNSLCYIINSFFYQIVKWQKSRHIKYEEVLNYVFEYAS